MKQFTKLDVINYLISKGNNSETAKYLTEKNYDYCKDAYKGASLKEFANVIRTIY